MAKIDINAVREREIHGFMNSTQTISTGKQAIKDYLDNKSEYIDYGNAFIVGKTIEIPSLEDFDERCVVRISRNGDKMFGVCCVIHMPGCAADTATAIFLTKATFYYKIKAYNENLQYIGTYPDDDVCKWGNYPMIECDWNPATIVRKEDRSDYHALKALAGKTIEVVAEGRVGVLRESKTELNSDGLPLITLSSRRVNSFIIRNKDSFFLDCEYRQLINEKKIVGLQTDSTVILFDGLQKINEKDWSFKKDNITRLFIPASVSEISLQFLNEFSSLNTIVVADNNPIFYSDDGILYNKDKSVLLFVPNGLNMSSFSIPETVTKIGKKAFCWCKGIKDVFLPNSIVEIENEAFENSGITRILLPCNLDKISYAVFQGCSSLTSIEFTNNIKSIGNNAFWGCSSLLYVDIPNSVESIGKNAFRDCSSLKSIDMPNSVKFIERKAFSGCRCLKSIFIPNKILSIGESAFEECSSLCKIVIPDGCFAIENSAFSGCNSIRNIYLPNSITIIEDSAFSGCTSLQSISLPLNLELIGTNIFEGCISLSQVEFPSGLTSISKKMFSGCSNLSHVALPDSINLINAKAFYGCSSLRNIDLPSKVEIIEDDAFANCSVLNKINLFDSTLKKIGKRTFENCRELEFIDIPNSVIEIGDEAFKGCTQLNRLELSNEIRIIPKNLFWGCESLSEITLPEGVTCIEDNSFWGCKNLEKLFIPKSVERIQCNPFLRCTSLNAITVDVNNSSFSAIDGVLVDSVKSHIICVPNGKPIKDYTIPSVIKGVNEFAFYGSTSLKTIVITEGVSSIGENVFYDCPELTCIYSLLDNPERTSVASSFVDEEKYNKCTLIVPDSTRWDYRHHPVWGKFNNIQTASSFIDT